MNPPLDDSTIECTRGVTEGPDRRTTVWSEADRWLGSAMPAVLVVGASLMMAVVLGSPATVARAQDDPGGELYAQFCASCHQAAGEGIPGVFPPLIGNPAAADPVTVTDAIVNGRSGPVEVLGITYDETMEPVPELTGADLELVVAYVTELAGPAAAGAEVTDTAVDTPVPAGPLTGDAGRGHDLFLGSERLENGGVACASCHTAGSIGNLGGRSLGPDLSTVFATLGGEPGLSGWLSNPPARTMSPIYVDRPLSEPEIADLVAYLATAPDTGQPEDAVDGLLVAGSGGVVILLGGMAIAWRGMRQTYHQRLRSRS